MSYNPNSIVIPPGAQLGSPYPVVNYVDPVWFGAVGDGVTDDLAAFQAAVATGLPVWVRKGASAYFLSGPLNISNCPSMFGDGAISYSVSPSGTAMTNSTVDGKFSMSGITLNLNGRAIVFTSLAELNFNDVSFVGTTTPSSTKLTAQGIWTKGVTLANITGCSFVDFNDAIYLDQNAGGTSTQEVFVTNCKFSMTAYGTFWQFPAQIYQFYCNYLTVTGCFFKNIYPGNPGSPRWGVCVYEGDGVALATTVTDCTYVAEEGRTDTFFLYPSTSKNVSCIGNVCKCTNASGSGYLFLNGSGAESVIISGNQAKRFDILIAEGDDVGNVVIDGNAFDRSGGVSLNAAIRIGANNNVAADVTITDNVFSNCLYGGIFINGATWFTISGNSFTDINTTNTAYTGSNVWQVSCIGVAGSSHGRIDANHGANTVAGAGRAVYGVGIGIGPDFHAINVSSEGRYEFMGTAPVLNGFSATSPPGLYPYFSYNEQVDNSEPAASQTPGWVCVSNVNTTLSSTFNATDTALAVVSSTGMAIGDYIVVEQDDGTPCLDVVAAVPDGTHVTLTTGLTATASSGARVRTNRFKAKAAIAA